MRVLTVLFFFLASVSLKAQETVRFAIGEWPPFHGKSLPQNGQLTDLIVSLIESAGYNVEIVWLPWKRAYHQVENGTYHVTGVWSFNATRCEQFNCSEPLLQMRNRLFARKSDRITIATFADLKPYTIGLTIGYTYPDLRQAGVEYELNLTEARSDLLNMRKLMVGNIDLFMANVDVGTYLIENHFTVAEARKIEILDAPSETMTMGILITKQNPLGEALHLAVNQLIIEWRNTGKLDTFLNKSNQPK